MKKIILLLLPSYFLLLTSAGAWEYQYGRNTFRLTAIASGGVMNNENFRDFLVRAQASRLMDNRWNMGAVYAIDANALDRDYLARDAFVYVDNEWGRVETGWTESIAAKMALVLPDVGGTRTENAPFFLKDGFNGITNMTVSGNQYAWRVNMATVPTRPLQFGIGQTLIRPDGFNSSTDIGLRYRNPHGRVKSGASLGLSYVARPHNFIGDTWLWPTTAKARYQGTAGLNLQFGSLVWAAVGKIIVDDEPIVEPGKTRSDGFAAGTGFMYDFLSWSGSINYVFSDVGVWAGQEIKAHTGVFSLRYKIHQNFNIWASVGATAIENGETNKFVSGGIGTRF